MDDLDVDSEERPFAAPPQGTQDLLFEAARRLRRCEAALARFFEERGFAEVIPPALEAAEVFALASPHGETGALRTVDRHGHLLAVRADFTAQVARIAATRLARVSPLRLYYRGSVIRETAAETGTARERLQAGCELVGVEGPEADAEMLELAVRSLHVLGLAKGSARIAVGNVDYFSALIEAAGVSPRLARSLTDAIDRKDLSTLAALCTREIEAGKAREAILMLAQPPRPESEASALLQRARDVAPSPRATGALDRLAKVLAGARAIAADLEVDLGEVRGLGYYTGLVFNLYASGAPRAVGGGGRYDGLLGKFGDPRPAVGFSLDLDALVPLASPA